MPESDAFRNLWNAGFRTLIPIIPPDADVSPASTLYKRKANSLGKAPGIRGQDGLWRGFDWLRHETKESDLALWASYGAGTGIKTGDGLVAIDVDTKNPELCVVIGETIQKHLGSGAVRVGNAPKFLVLFRASDDVPYERIEFSDGIDKAPRVEALGKGRQFVAHGIHPATRKPYRWPKGFPVLEALPIVSAAQVHKFFDALADILPAASLPVVEARSGKIPAQHTLRGEYDHVRRAVAALPNTEELFPIYDDYIRVGAAIKAALWEQPAADGLELFLQWAGRWPGFDLATATGDYSRIKPPFKCGAGWLYDRAESYSDGAFSRASVFFRDITDADLPGEPDIFTLADEANRERERTEANIAWIDPREWEGKAPPPRQWIVDGVIPAGEVTLLTGAGGVGKTLLAQQMATSIAAGTPFLNCNTKQGRVLLFLCEDDEHELHRRQRDINASLCLSLSEISSNMRIASRKHMDNLLVVFDRASLGKMTKTALWHSVYRTILDFQPDMVVVDTIADVFGGSEIDRQQVRQFVQGALGGFASATGCAVLALGHPSRAGESSGEGTSGSTAWHASVRSRLYLTHATKDGRGPFRKLQAKKANYGPAGSEWLLRWERGAFEVHTAATVGEAGSAGENTQTDYEVLDGLIASSVQKLYDLSIRTTLSARSTDSLAKKLKLFDESTFAIYEPDRIATAIQRLVAQGRIEERPRCMITSRGLVSTVMVVDPFD